MLLSTTVPMASFAFGSKKESFLVSGGGKATTTTAQATATKGIL